jgi:Tfp pilus assembly protein PilV
MIELMISGVVLIVGFLAVMILIIGAIAGNNRNRMDSSGTMLAQMVMERIASVPANSTTTMTVTDCASATWTINPAGSTAGAGAPLTSANAINFTSAQVTNYSMNYVVCGANSTQTTYDVRWNVRTLTANTALVTVAARPRGASTNQLQRFAIPVSLRSIVGR